MLAFVTDAIARGLYSIGENAHNISPDIHKLHTVKRSLNWIASMFQIRNVNTSIITVG